MAAKFRFLNWMAVGDRVILQEGVSLSVVPQVLEMLNQPTLFGPGSALLVDGAQLALEGGDLAEAAAVIATSAAQATLAAASTPELLQFLEHPVLQEELQGQIWTAEPPVGVTAAQSDTESDAESENSQGPGLPVWRAPPDGEFAFTLGGVEAREDELDDLALSECDPEENAERAAFWQGEGEELPQGFPEGDALDEARWELVSQFSKGTAASYQWVNEDCSLTAAPSSGPA